MCFHCLFRSYPSENGSVHKVARYVYVKCNVNGRVGLALLGSVSGCDCQYLFFHYLL